MEINSFCNRVLSDTGYSYVFPKMLFWISSNYQYLPVCGPRTGSTGRGQSAQAAYLSSVSGQIRDHFGVWACEHRVFGRSAITNPELYRIRDSVAILSRHGKLSNQPGRSLTESSGKESNSHSYLKTELKPSLRFDYPQNTPNTASRPIRDVGKRWTVH
jgi:hypothetical protein